MYYDNIILCVIKDYDMYIYRAVFSQMRFAYVNSATCVWNW